MANDSANFEARSGDVGVKRGNAAPIPDMEAEGQTARTAGGGEVIGRVAAPPQLESTPEHFHFWVERDRLVETNQFVRTESTVGGQAVQFFGIIDEVRRSSRKRDILEEYDVADGDALFEPPFKPEGVTYARASVLRTTPDIFTPALEQSVVQLGGEEEARFAYGFTEMKRALAVGLLRNGARATAGPALIDLAYLLGEQGGHLNVNGMAGVAAKSSFLLTVVRLLLDVARPRRAADTPRSDRPEGAARRAGPLHVVPIVLNVKGEDLMWINQRNRDFELDRERHAQDWRALGVEPEAFTDASFFSPTLPGTDAEPTVAGCEATAYSWSLSDVLAGDLFQFLFSEEDGSTEIMMGLVRDYAASITQEDGRTLRNDAPQTWEELLREIRRQADDPPDKMYGKGTWRAVYRRLSNIIDEGRSIFPFRARRGNPLRVVRPRTSPPQVVDINSLPVSLQRFVVAAVLRQIVEARTGRGAVPGLRYLIVLDELNRFAPRGSSDPITRLLERVATEMRSQGIILLGAQQMASQVSTKIIEMSSIRVLGRTGPAELQDKVWQSWDKPARRQATVLKQEDKLVMQPTFRQPMLVRVPHPAWAMRKEDIAPLPLDQLPGA
jgi:hypothetical protein